MYNYYVKVDNNSRGFVTFENLCEACEYAKNVSNKFSPFDATVNNSKHEIIAHYILGKRF